MEHPEHQEPMGHPEPQVGELMGCQAGTPHCLTIKVQDLGLPLLFWLVQTNTILASAGTPGAYGSGGGAPGPAGVLCMLQIFSQRGCWPCSAK